MTSRLRAFGTRRVVGESAAVVHGSSIGQCSRLPGMEEALTPPQLPRGFTYMPGLFDLPSAEAYLATLRVEVAWERRDFTIYGRAIAMPRLIAMYGPVGYRYSGVEHAPRPMPARVAAIRDRVEAVTGTPFNSVLLNLYRDGRDSVSWHRDNDYDHGGQPDIASVSLGATRRFQLRDEAGRRAAIALESGSLLLATGEALERWWHCVPKTAQAVGPRVNLTFRYMIGLK